MDHSKPTRLSARRLWIMAASGVAMLVLGVCLWAVVSALRDASDGSNLVITAPPAILHPQGPMAAQPKDALATAATSIRFASEPASAIRPATRDIHPTPALKISGPISLAPVPLANVPLATFPSFRPPTAPQVPTSEGSPWPAIAASQLPVVLQLPAPAELPHAAIAMSQAPLILPTSAPAELPHAAVGALAPGGVRVAASARELPRIAAAPSAALPASPDVPLAAVASLRLPLVGSHVAEAAVPDRSAAIAANTEAATVFGQTPATQPAGPATAPALDSADTARIRVSRAPPLEDQRAMLAGENANAPPDFGDIPSVPMDGSAAPASANKPTSVQFITNIECGTPLSVHEVTPTHYAAEIITEGFRDWFMFRLHGVGGKTIRIDLRAPGMSMDKWESLNPVFTYAADLALKQAYPATL